MSEHARILRRLADGDSWTRSRLVSELGSTAASVDAAIAELGDNGCVLETGADGGVSWHEPVALLDAERIRSRLMERHGLTLGTLRASVVTGSTNAELMQARQQLHQAGDATDLADKMQQLLSDAALGERLKQAGRRFVESERNWGASIANYQAAYARMLA